MATRTRTRKPKPVPIEDIKQLIEERATAEPEVPAEAPKPTTLFDQIGDLAFFVKEVSRQAGIPIGSVIAIAQIRMNYEVAMRQLLQQAPPWLQNLQQPEPANEAEQETP